MVSLRGVKTFYARERRARNTKFVKFKIKNPLPVESHSAS